MNDTVGKRIKDRREKKGITQEELAKTIVESRSWIGNIETDKRPLPSVDSLERLCKALDTTPTYILWGYEEKDVAVGEDLGLSGEVVQKLKRWKDTCDYDAAENGYAAFPISKQLDYILSVLVDSPLVVMMLYEYLTCNYEKVTVYTGDSSAVSISTKTLFAEGGFFSTTDGSCLDLEATARLKLMDTLKQKRDRLLKGGKKDGKS